MSNDDWYRNKKWDDKIEAHFFKKLSRSRSGRDQYLVIQALTLTETKPEVTLRLAQLFFETRTDDFHDVQAYLAIADAYKSLGQFEAAIRYYKSVLKREMEFPKHLTNVYVELPYLIATLALDEHYEFALGLLTEGLCEITFPVDEFMFYASNALIASEQGLNESASIHAQTAIKVAGVKKSGFRYHQSIGLVGDQHKSTMKKILRLS